MSEEKESYSRILKSSSLIGGAQGVSMLVMAIRVKIEALIIGPLGIGMVETYRATVQLIGTFSGLGLQSSAVRSVAEAVASEDEERIGRTILTLRRMCWLTGISGSVAVVLFSAKLSQISFGSSDHAVHIAWVGLIVLFANVQGGQMAFVQGMRRIGDLAKLNLLGTALGSLVCVGLYSWLRERGIVPAIVAFGFVQLFVSWWFARKIPVPKVAMSWAESFKTAGGMIKLGLAFMWSSLLIVGVAYATRAMIAREISLVAVGIFSAAYTLSGSIIHFVLRAMGADYYPALTAVNHDHKKMCNLVNQQTEIGLLLAVPGVLATLVLAPLAIRVFYTSEFWPAIDLLRWFSLGILGRVVCWPMGFVLLAKGKGKLFAIKESLQQGTHTLFIWAGLLFFGLVGVSIAFVALYVISIVFLLIMLRYLIRFSWSRGVCNLLIILLPVVVLTFLIGIFLPEVPAIYLGILLTFGTSLFCLRGLVFRLGMDHRACRLLLKVPGMKYAFIGKNRIF